VVAETLTNEELAAKVITLFQEWPLYRELNYSGPTAATNPPREIRLDCGHAKCGFQTRWALSTNYSIFASGTRGMRPEPTHDNFAVARYVCKNCSSRVTRFFYFWSQKDSIGQLFKIGQYPQIEERVPKNLQDALGEEDLKSYKNALRLRNFNLGIAAVAYMRRVVENRMNDMLNVLYEAARTHKVSAEVLARHEDVMKDHRFIERVNYAGELLPESLRPQGQPNPMAILHEFASDGLHTKSDEQCVEIFDACRRTFEYVFEKMRLENEAAKKFVTDMAALTAKKQTIRRPEPVPDSAEPPEPTST